MTAFKKISIVFLCITLVMLTVLAFTSCDGERLENGILYNGTAVIGADKDAESLTVKDGTTSIAAGAFADCGKLTSLTLPDSITEIAQSAFSGCDALIKSEGGVSYVDGWITEIQPSVTSVELTDAVRGFAEESFMDAINLESITFTGDTEIWENIKKSIPQSVISKINVTINPNNS